MQSEKFVDLIVFDPSDQAVVLILSVLLIAVLLFFWRVVLGVLLRLFRLIYLPGRWVVRQITRAALRVLRLLRLAPKQAAPPSATDLAITAGGIQLKSEIEEALDETPDVEPSKRSSHALLFYSVEPPQSRMAEYTEAKARRDAKFVAQFFSATVPPSVNPLALYDEIHGAEMVRLFKDSDHECYRALFELRRAISGNAFMLYLSFSMIMALVFVVNVMWGDALDFYTLFGLSAESSIVQSMSVFVQPGMEPVAFNKFLFPFVVVIPIWFVMYLVLKFYEVGQYINGKNLNSYMNNYLNDIKVRTSRVDSLAQATLVGERDGLVGEESSEPQEAAAPDANISSRSAMWIENLHWMALRVFYVQQFYKIVMFQAKRNSALAAFFVPFGFITVFLLVSLAFQASFWQEDGMVGAHHSSLYVLFPLLSYWTLRRFSEAFNPVTDAVKERWITFADMELITSMDRILGVYESHLREWKERRKASPGPR